MVQEEVWKCEGILKIKENDNTEIVCLLSEVFVTHTSSVKKIKASNYCK